MMAMLQDIRRLYSGRHAIVCLVQASLKVRYQQSALGFLWTLLHPILMLTVLAVVFGHLLRFNIENYPVYLFCGLLPWQFFSGSLSNASISLINNQGLIRKIGVQLITFPLAELGITAFNMLMAMVAMFLIMLFFGARVSEHTLLVPVGMLLLFVLTLGLSLIAMTLTTYFRDCEHFISVALQAGYFLTPIFYRPQDVPGIEWLLELNPLTWVIAFFHHGLYYHTWPEPKIWMGAVAVSSVSLLVGYAVYKKHEHDFIFRL